MTTTAGGTTSFTTIGRSRVVSRYGRAPGNRKKSIIGQSSSGNAISIYGVNSLENSQKIFADPKFRVHKHTQNLYSKISASDAKYLVRDLESRKAITSTFLSEHVVRQYTDFISMSRYVLEIEDQMSEMDDMLKSMSMSMKSLQSTNFRSLLLLIGNHGNHGGHSAHSGGRHVNMNPNPAHTDLSPNLSVGLLGLNEEEQRDRAQQEMEALESMHEQISQHIQLRQLQQATDLIVTAKSEYQNLKRSAKRRAIRFINAHIIELHDLIAEQLTNKIYLPEIKREKLCILLMRLGYIDETMQLFLKYKSRSLKQLIRNISLYGDVKQYIQDLSHVFFDQLIDCTIKYTNLLNKIQEYTREILSSGGVASPSAAGARMHGYPHHQSESESEDDEDDDDDYYDTEDEKMDVNTHNRVKKQGGHNGHHHNNTAAVKKFDHKNSMHMSRLIVWMYKELELYVKLFAQQVFQLEQNDFRTIGECLKITFKQSERLDRSGIHVSFLLSKQFKSSIESAINRLYKKTLEQVRKCMAAENWISKSKNVTNTSRSVMLHKKRMSRRLSAKNLATNLKLMESQAQASANSARKPSAMAASKLHNRRTSAIFGGIANTSAINVRAGTGMGIGMGMGIANTVNNNKTVASAAGNTSASQMNPSPSPNTNTTAGVVAAKKKGGGLNKSRRASTVSIGNMDGEQFSVVKLTKSGQVFYEVVKKCIQETWRLLDNKYYTSLTKSVYRSVVTQMIFLIEVYCIQVATEINNRAPKQLILVARPHKHNATANASRGRTSSVDSSHSSSSYKSSGDEDSDADEQSNNNNNRKRSESGNADTAGNVLARRRNNAQNASANNSKRTRRRSTADDDIKEHPTMTTTTAATTTTTTKNSNNGSAVPNELNEQQMLSLIANVYYVSEDLIQRILYRYSKLFARQIPELLMFQTEQKKLYETQFTQFAKRMLKKWVVDILGWKRGQISVVYKCKPEVNAMTSAVFSDLSVSQSMLDFVAYVVQLRQWMHKYLGRDLDLQLLQESLLILLTELMSGDYIFIDNTTSANPQMSIISLYGLHVLYLDFRFFIITLHQFVTAETKKLCMDICEKGKRYVSKMYEIDVDVDWKLMHAMATKLQYKVLNGDQLDILNKVVLTD